MLSNTATEESRQVTGITQPVLFRIQYATGHIGTGVVIAETCAVPGIVRWECMTRGLL